MFTHEPWPAFFGVQGTRWRGRFLWFSGTLRTQHLEPSSWCWHDRFRYIKRSLVWHHTHTLTVFLSTSLLGDFTWNDKFTGHMSLYVAVRLYGCGSYLSVQTEVELLRQGASMNPQKRFRVSYSYISYMLCFIWFICFICFICLIQHVL